VRITGNSALSAPARVRVFRQDASVSAPTEEEISKDSIGSSVQGPRVGIVTGRGEFKARADKDGNYLYFPENKRFNQVQAFVSAQKTLELLEDYADRKIEWAFPSQALGVIPHAGEGKNAYYARWNQSVSFYSFDSRHLKKTVHTAQSSDVVAHETGHAILDGLKPEWGKTFDRETKASHEGFGDCAAMLLTISRPENRADALRETDRDLTQDNCISRIAEEFGESVRLANRDPNDDRKYLRNANNSFSYKPPAELPRDGSREDLTAEAHSFCQVFTRAFYQSVVGAFGTLKNSGMNDDEALRQAGADMGGLLAKGITMSSPNRARFADIAKAMLRADRLAGSPYQAGLQNAFLKTEIVNQADLADLNAPLPQGTPQEILQKLGAENYDFSRSVTDDLGYETREYLLKEETTLPSQAGWGLTSMAVDVTAGLSITFDPEGKLVHVARQDRDVESELAGLPEPDQLLSGSPLPEVRLVPTLTGLKIERLPVFLD
jgi:hypothetical protein